MAYDIIGARIYVFVNCGVKIAADLPHFNFQRLLSLSSFLCTLLQWWYFQFEHVIRLGMYRFFSRQKKCFFFLIHTKFFVTKKKIVFNKRQNKDDSETNCLTLRETSRYFHTAIYKNENPCTYILYRTPLFFFNGFIRDGREMEIHWSFVIGKWKPTTSNSNIDLYTILYIRL